jgi:hypothetical protein
VRLQKFRMPPSTTSPVPGSNFSRYTVGSMCCPTSFLPYEVGGRTARCGCGVQAPALFCDPFQLGYSVVVMVVRVRLDIADVTTPPSFIRTVTLGFRAEELVR